MYDSHQRLCKTVEPESLATLIDYDNAGNIAWRAAGQNLTGTSSCDQGSVPANQQTSYAYDARNRLTDTTFGDASPAIHTTYTADGLPNTTTADGSTWTYGYNHRRLLTSELLNVAGRSYPRCLNKYDFMGHATYASYPQRTINSVGDNPAGTSSTYDALGRITSSVAYLTGFQKQVRGWRSRRSPVIHS